jgi:hypothetical protein
VYTGNQHVKHTATESGRKPTPWPNYVSVPTSRKTHSPVTKILLPSHRGHCWWLLELDDTADDEWVQATLFSDPYSGVWGARQAGRSWVLVPIRSFNIFNLFTPSRRTVAPGFTQPLTEMSTRRSFWGVERRRFVGLTTSPLSVSQLSRQHGNPWCLTTFTACHSDNFKVGCLHPVACTRFIVYCLFLWFWIYQLRTPANALVIVRLLDFFSHWNQMLGLSLLLWPFVGPWPLFSVSHRTTQTQNKCTHTSVPRVRFEPMISMFERAKTVHALDRAAAVFGTRPSKLTITLIIGIPITGRGSS